MLIYYCITILLNVVAVIVFYKNINITALSALPFFLITLMLFQALVFKNAKVENGFRTAYGSNLTAQEENKMFCNNSAFLFAAIPLMIPFVIFFSSPLKMLSLLVYIIGLIDDPVLYRLKNKDKISNRINAEENELQEQEKKEQLGKWK